VGSRQWAVGSGQSAVGGRQCAVGVWQKAVTPVKANDAGLMCATIDEFVWGAQGVFRRGSCSVQFLESEIRGLGIGRRPGSGSAACWRGKTRSDSSAGCTMSFRA